MATATVPVVPDPTTNDWLERILLQLIALNLRARLVTDDDIALSDLSITIDEDEA